MASPTLTDLLHDALSAPAPSVAYRIGRALTAHFPSRIVLQVEQEQFDPWELAAAGGCELTTRADPYAEITTRSRVPDDGVASYPRCALYDVRWGNEKLVLVTATWPEGFSCTRHPRWIVADTQPLAERFLSAVAGHCHIPRDSVLVFSNNHWSKDKDLYRAIQASTFDDLVLAGSLKSQIVEDFTRFLSSRDEYTRYGVPWKRGVLFVGPPGNGKTHCLRATIKLLGVPCLYVQSLQSRYETEDTSILRVFERARSLNPCCLVFEDLDAMIHGGNRSCFLNQLDGLSHNEGILTLATTNHPDRLDPAIVDRPSRFDRKYHFELPARTERLAYVKLWNAPRDRAMRLSAKEEQALADATDGFSFAYVKELFVSSMVRWMATREPGAMGRVMSEQLVVLREQMHSENRAAQSEPRILRSIEDVRAEMARTRTNGARETVATPAPPAKPPRARAGRPSRPSEAAQKRR
jgi:AAA+ superfamily predicted ATPase